MTITITRGAQVRRSGTFGSTESLSAVTSTATQTVSISTDVTEITGSTATITNYYTLADGTEGQEKVIRYLATAAGGDGTSTGGDVQILSDNWRFTSSATFRSAGQHVRLKFMNGAWERIGGNTREEAWASASGAIPLTVDHVRFNGVTGTDQVYSLADGYEGQRMVMIAPVGTTVRTVTPSNMWHFTSLQFGGAAGGAFGGTNSDIFTEMMFTGGSWGLTGPDYRPSSTTTATDSSGIPHVGI